MDGIDPPAGGNANRRPPMFTVISALLLFMSLWTPMLLLSFAIMVTVGAAVVGLFRRERLRWLAVTVVILALALLLTPAGSINKSKSDAALSSVSLASWNWEKDPSYGTQGAIRWRAAIENRTDRPIQRVKVEFSTYDGSNRLITSTADFIRAIPPQGFGSMESTADLYGTEATAQARVVEVTFADDR